MKIDQLPFYWRLKKKGSKNIVPDFQPFEFDFREDLQLVTQKMNDTLLEHLETIYKGDYNIGYLQDCNEIARPYGTDFMGFIERSLDHELVRVKRMLEIGCGGCTVLEYFKSKDYDTLGIDPSPIAERAAKAKGIDLIPDFFPSDSFQEKVDLIFHSDVLEHVSNPVDFLKEQKKQLNESGIVIVNVPDCTESIQKGDLSMIIHQHINYFDLESLRNTVEAAGFKVLSLEVAKYGGSLYCCAINQENSSYSPKSGKEKFLSYVSKTKSNSQALVNDIKEIISDESRTLGFYVPLRTLPFLALMDHSNKFRFFDDTNHWYNCAFDGVEVYIENYDDLKENPVTDLFIMSLTFGDVIYKKVIGGKIGSDRIYKITDYLN